MEQRGFIYVGQAKNELPRKRLNAELFSAGSPGAMLYSTGKDPPCCLNSYNTRAVLNYVGVL